MQGEKRKVNIFCPSALVLQKNTDGMVNHFILSYLDAYVLLTGWKGTTIIASGFMIMKRGLATGVKRM